MEYYVIVYDVRNDKRRNRIFKILKDYATPVQFSVFEAYIHPHDLIELKYKLLSNMNSREDTIFFYRQCANCKGRVERMGISPHIYGENDIII